MKNFVTIGRLANAVYVQGDQDKIILSNTAPDYSGGLALTPAADFTYSLWFTPVFTPGILGGNGVILTNTRGAGSYWNGIYIAAQTSNPNLAAAKLRYYFQVDAGATNQQQYTLATDWIYSYGLLTHLLIIKKGANASNWKIYVNGVRDVAGLNTGGTMPTLNSIPSNYMFGKPYPNVTTYGSRFYLSSFKIVSRELTAQEIAAEYAKESRAQVPNTEVYLDFTNKKGLAINDYRNQMPFTLTNYSNAETANAGQPQSGNTAWVNAYSLLPITA